MISIAEYAATKGITVRIVRDDGIVTGADGWTHHAYRVQIRHDGRQMTVDWREGTAITGRPTERVADILDSLASDAAGYLAADGVEEWAGEYGMTLDEPADRRRARLIYDKVSRYTAKLQILLGGREELDHLLYEIGRDDDAEGTPAARLEYLRGELRAERISQGELIELQNLVEHIDPGDVELLEAAGVPEHADE